MYSRAPNGKRNDKSNLDKSTSQRNEPTPYSPTPKKTYGFVDILIISGKIDLRLRLPILPDFFIPNLSNVCAKTAVHTRTKIII